MRKHAGFLMAVVALLAASATAAQAVVALNGASFNGVSLNGLSVNQSGGLIGNLPLRALVAKALAGKATAR